MPAMFDPSFRAYPWWDVTDPYLKEAATLASDAIPALRGELTRVLETQSTVFQALGDQALVAASKHASYWGL
jgi:hypothetical protein